MNAATNAFDYVYAVIHPAGVAAMCIIALRCNARAAPWLVALLNVVSIIDIARGPQVPVLSAVSISAGASAVIATLLLRHRLAIVSAVLCSASLAATLVGGLLLR